jgi:hypothetical protein
VAPSFEAAQSRTVSTSLQPCPCPVPRTDPSVGTDEEQGAVRAIGGEAKDGGMQVLVVARQVDEGDHLRAALTDLFCCP